MKRIFSFFTISLAFALAGCFDEAAKTAGTADGSSTTTKVSLIKDFAGAKSASNRITGIQIGWDAPATTVSSYRIYRVSGTKLSLLTTLAPSVTGYVDGSASWGNIYSYIVRAVDQNNIEELNMVKVSALSWGGIASIQVSGRSNITLNFASTSAVADEVRVYAQPAGGGNRVLVATATGSDTEVSISGLRVGYSYTISAQAFVAALKKEDGNSATFKITTNTLGYHDEDTSFAKWMNIVNIRAFGSSPGSPVSPTTPEKTPQTDLVELSFKSFNGMDSTTKYVVTRAAIGHKLDTSVSDLCTTTSLDSCRVMCSTSSIYLSGSGILNCRDLKIAPSPARYRYTMSIEHTEGTDKWVESVPEDSLENFSVIVPIPPKNMVLVQRDAVNYEMCSQMSVNPDPKNHNRCAYTGIGAVPYNSGPGKPALTFESGYYDFGYNLFEDRYPLGCNWTTAANGGKCGTGGASGDCIGLFNGTTMVDPPASIGKDGDVFELLATWGETSRCYLKISGAWYSGPPSAGSYADYYSKIFTSDPATNNGKISPSRRGTTQILANNVCMSQTDSNYGAKRLPRMREFRAFQAFPTIPGELYGVTYTKANTIFQGSGNTAATGYNCGVSSGTSYPKPASLAAMLLSTNEFYGVSNGSVFGSYNFQMNAIATVDCQSRYGAQHVNLWSPLFFVSDMFNWNSPLMTITGTSSNVDTGNRDLVQDINGGQTGYQLAYSAATVNGTTDYYYTLATNGSTAVNFMSIPMGLPVLTSTSNTYLSRLLFNEPYSATIRFPYTAAANYTNRAVGVAGRWYTSMNTGPTDTTYIYYRCVMSAD